MNKEAEYKIQKFTNKLAAIGVFYGIKNNGAHIIVEGNKGYIDVWPTTGKWKIRGAKETSFGLRQLIKALDKDEV